MNKTTVENPSPLSEPGSSTPDETSASNAVPVEIQITPLAFLRSMVVLLWTALRYPFQTTEVDLSTGRVVRHY